MTTTITAPLSLSEDQQRAYEAFTQFLLDPEQQVFVLAGYAGTGKSTLVGYLLEQLPKLKKTAQLLNPNSTLPRMDVLLTATTNKAAESLSRATGERVNTIHAALGIIVRTDYATGRTQLSIKPSAELLCNTLLFIDEASYIDSELLQMIFTRTDNCKIVFIGDPAQLVQVNARHAPVFTAGFPTARLTQIVRQAEGNPIIELANRFRHTVESGEFFSFTPDDKHIRHLDRDAFDALLIQEFSQPDWHYHRSKVLAWTNKRVVAYNHAIRDAVAGSPVLHVGDYAVCNSYVYSGGHAVKTDQLVLITSIWDHFDQATQVAGKYYELDHGAYFFMPNDPADHARALKAARAAGNLHLAATITDTWIDLRAAYACTINKAQGSTFDRVFIDLDDLKRCRNGNTLARLLYVAVSRARYEVVFTGDLI